MKLVNPLRLIAGLATIGLLAASGTSYAAGTAAFSLSSVSATEGDTATVAIYENGDTVNAVTAAFTYDSGELQFVSDACAGAFSSTVTSSSSSITCFVPGGSSAVSGTNQVATLSFKTIATGAANITVTGSQIASNGANAWNGSSVSSTVTVSAPATAPQPAPTTTTRSTSSSKSTTPTTSNKPATTPAPTTTTVSGSTSKPTTQNKHTSSKPTPIKSRHTGLVTSTLIGLLVIVLAVYWTLVRKRPEEAAPTVYKLNGTGKTTGKTQHSKAAKKPSSRATTAKKAPVHKAVKK